MDEWYGDCNCSKWKQKEITLVDKETDEVQTIKVCSVCEKEIK